MIAFLFRLFGRLPLSALHALGALLGAVVYVCSSRNRRLIRENLAIAGLSGQVSPWRIMAHAGHTVAELPWLWQRPQTEIVGKIKAVSGREYVDAARNNPKGILYLTPHLGCFEITAQYLATLAPITVLYRRPKQDWLVPLVEGGRGENLGIAPADVSGVRSLMRALRNGEAIGMLPDQVPGNGEGSWVPFFGKPAYTMTLAARLAEAGATVLLTYAERLPCGRGYHLHFLPLPAELSGTPTDKSGQLNLAIEQLIRQCPEQYAWNYNRYKVPAGVARP